MALDESRLLEKRESVPHLFIFKAGFGEDQQTFSPLQEAFSQFDVDAVIGGHPEFGEQESFKRDLSEARGKAQKLYDGKIDGNKLLHLIDAIPPPILKEALHTIKIVESSSQGSNKPIVLAGHSEGAAAVAAALFLRPDLYVDHLILVNPAGITTHEGPPGHYLELAETLAQGKRRTLQTFLPRWLKSLNVTARYAYALGVAEKVESIWKKLVGSPQKKEEASRMSLALSDSLRHIGELWSSGELVSKAHSLGNFDALPYLALLHDIKGVAVDVIYDANDLLFPMRKIEKRVAEHAPWIKLHQTKGFGHFGPVKNPDYFVPKIKGLLHA